MKKIKIPKVLVIYKKSSYESHVFDQRDKNFLRLLREKNAAILKSKSTHDIHRDTLETVKQDLRDLQIPFKVRLRYHLEPIRGYDLIVTIGGDGTFLETSHYLEGGCLLGINSVPRESVGFFCRGNADNFLEKMRQFMHGTSVFRTFHRLATTVDGRPQGPLALNDILFANQNPAGTTRYVLKVRGKKEEQKSSGVWVSPAAGSTAATRSAGGSVLPLTSKKFQYVVREPYTPTGRGYQRMRGVLAPDEKVEILSMMDEATVYIDGPHCATPVRRGSVVLIKNADCPIRVVW